MRTWEEQPLRFAVIAAVVGEFLVGHTPPLLRLKVDNAVGAGWRAAAKRSR
jgi:hypothetical protein